MSNEFRYIRKIEKYRVDVWGTPTEQGTEVVSDIDRSFMGLLNEKIADLYQMYFPAAHITARPSSQETYVAMMEDALAACARPDGKLSMFTDIPDHLNRAMRRFLLTGSKYNYIVDVFATLDVGLQISPLKRFVLTHIPRKWIMFKNKDIVCKIRYQTRVWNSALSYYTLTHFYCDLNVPYSSQIERARSLVGTLKICKPNERRMYERVDYETRRAMFNDFHNVQQKRFVGRGA